MTIPSIDDIIRASKVRWVLSDADSRDICLLANEVERLRNKLNADSQNFELECRKAEIELLRAEIGEPGNSDKRIAELEATNERLAAQGVNHYITELETERDEALAEVKRLKSANNSLTAQVERLWQKLASGVPSGTGVCYLSDHDLVLLGYPTTEDHNCNAMGCGSLDHVVARHRLTPEQVERLRDGATVGVSELHLMTAFEAARKALEEVSK